MLQQSRQRVASASGRRAAAATAPPQNAATPTATAARRRRLCVPPPLAWAASSSPSVADAPPHQTTTTNKPAVTVRPYANESELRAVARLRAEAYHESDSSRFAATFKKQFAEREAASLLQRTAAPSDRGPPRCECLVAVAPAASSGNGSSSSSGSGGGSGSVSTEQHEVLGCIDLRPPPHAAATTSSSGVPPEDAAAGCYLLNVVVSERARGKGVGEALMRAAMRRAGRAYGAERAYTHVEAGNGPAARLYARCGFHESGEAQGALAGAASLGRVLLLRADDLLLEEAGEQV